MHARFGFRFGCVAVTLWMIVPQAAFSEPADEKTNPVVGAWELTSIWGKGGQKSNGRHIVNVKSDRTGTIRDVQQGWTARLRNLTVSGNAVSFRFSYGEKDDYEVQFEGKLTDKKIDGKFSVGGHIAVVTGAPLTPAQAKSIIAAASVTEKFEARKFESSEGDTMLYRLFVPQEYDARKKYPVVLFHHGGSGAGSDNRRQLQSACVREWIRPEMQAKNPCFIVAPQIPGKESKSSKSLKAAKEVMQLRIRTVHEILDSLEKEFSIDKSREYVTGLSFGGACTWMSMHERPRRFAAAVPVCAGDWLMDRSIAEQGRMFAKFPLWIFHGDADTVISVDVSRKVVKALRNAGGEPKYTEYPGVDHYCWDLAYRDPKLIEWLFAQSRAPAPR